MKLLLVRLQLREIPCPEARLRNAWFRHAALLIVLVALFVLPLAAQRHNSLPRFDTGISVTGIVTQGDQPARGAGVELLNLNNGALATTIALDDGTFQISGLPAGEYLVTTSLGAQQVQNEISLTMSSAELRIHMPGGRSQPGASVTVQQLQVPEKARNAVLEAQKFAQRGDVAHAMDKLQQALTSAPTFAGALALRAALSLQSGDTAQALSDARAATRADSSYPNGFFVLAAALNRNSQFADAARVARQGMRLAPSAWQGHFELGQALAGQNLHGDALTEFNAAAQTAPATFSGVHLLRGVTLIRLQRYDDARNDLQEVVRRDPTGAGGSAAQQILARLQQASKAGN